MHNNCILGYPRSCDIDYRGGYSTRNGTRQINTSFNNESTNIHNIVRIIVGHHDHTISVQVITCQ